MISHTMVALRDYIVDVLQPPGTIKTRSTLEFFAERDLGVSANDVTRILDEMRRNELTQTAIPLPGAATSHAYSLGDPDPDEREQCVIVVQARQLLLQPEKLRDASERYVRAVFRHVRDRAASQYHAITNASRLGRIPIAGASLLADLLVAYETRSGERFSLLVEVKAHRERIDVTSPIIAKLLKDAVQAYRLNNYQPLLVASRIAPRARSFCEALGIAVYELGRQFLPTRDLPEARRLWPTAWQDRFQFIRPDRVFPNASRMDERSARDIQSFRERDWIESARARWVANAPAFDEILEARLRRRPDWNKLCSLLPAYCPTEK